MFETSDKMLFLNLKEYAEKFGSEEWETLKDIFKTLVILLKLWLLFGYAWVSPIRERSPSLHDLKRVLHRGDIKKFGVTP